MPTMPFMFPDDALRQLMERTQMNRLYQEMMQLPPGLNEQSLAGLPGPVIDSITSQPSYNEGQTVPRPAPTWWQDEVAAAPPGGREGPMFSQLFSPPMMTQINAPGSLNDRADQMERMRQQREGLVPMLPMDSGSFFQRLLMQGGGMPIPLK